MMMGEFATLIQTGFPVKIIVLNNGTLGFVELEMKASGFLDSQCGLRTRTSPTWLYRWASGVRVEAPKIVARRSGTCFRTMDRRSATS